MSTSLENQHYLEHVRCSGVVRKEREGLDMWLWRVKAPPIIMSPSSDKSGNSGLPIVSHFRLSSAPKAP